MESLYRKYRPQTFDDVVGQKHVVATLRRAVLEGRTSHAYLFCGPRGTGKTTMARLLAKALLCEQGAGHLPDGTCEQCQLIAAGEHPDVYELDAASNTGVDNVREEIINRVNYAPVRGDYKVYIIDEVHMLTPAAFNALLKTLEEPPEHVVFIMCTTDPQKILETILSRVQRFDFRPISNDELFDRLVYVCNQEGFTYDREALELIVLHARGGLRDGLSDLERLATYTSGAITLDAAQDLLGEVPASTLADVAMALATRDVPTLFGEVASLVDSGRDLLQFTRELCAHLRDAYVVAAVGMRPGVVSAQGEALERLGKEAQAFGSVDRVSRAMSVLGDASSEMRTAPNQRLVLELAFTRIARPESEVTLDALAERVSVLEGQLARLAAGGVATGPVTAPAQQETHTAGHIEKEEPVANPTAPARPAPAQPTATRPAPVRPATAQPAPVRPASAQQTPAQPASAQSAPTQSAAVSDPGDLQRRWRQVCDELRASMPSRGSLLMNTNIVSDDGQSLVVTLPAGSTFACKMLERQDVRDAMAPVVARAFGRRQISYVELGTKRAENLQGVPAASAASQPAPAPRADQKPQGASPQAARPQAQAASQPQHAQPQRATQPQARPAQQQAPAPQAQPVQRRPQAQPQPAPQPTYPAPWEDLPPYEEVPYSEADAAPYEEDEYFAPSPLPQMPAQAQPRPQPQHVPQPRPQSQTAPQAAPKPAPQAAPKPAPSQPQPKPAPAPQQKPEPAPAERDATPAPAPRADLPPEDQAALFDMLTNVFGPGVSISTLPANGGEGDAAYQALED